MTGGFARGRGARRAAAAVAAVVAALGLASCAEKVTTTDPAFSPEGTPSEPTRLLAWGEVPNFLVVYERGNPGGDPPIPDQVVRAFYVSNAVDIFGQFHGAVLDSTPASSYQVFRRDPDGGYREIFDYLAVPAKRWIDRGWEVYHFTDADTTVPSHVYRGRGIVRGGATLSSPLTLEATHSVRDVENIVYTGPNGFNTLGEPAPLDSLFPMEWEPVPGAAAYVIDVYQWSSNLVDLLEQLESGNPAPLFIGKSHDILVAYMPAPNPPGPTVSFRMPTPGARPPEARILTCRQTRYGQEYLVRIAAIDASGQLIAYTYGDASQQLTNLIIGGVPMPSTQYAIYPMGAVRVVPSRARTPGPARAASPSSNWQMAKAHFLSAHRPPVWVAPPLDEPRRP